MADREMDVREYRQYAEATHGKNSINEGMLKAMDRNTGGKKLSKGEWDQMNAKMKLRQLEVEGR